MKVQQTRAGFSYSTISFDGVVLDRSLREKDVDGRLHVASSNITKAAVNPYYGREIPGFRELGLDAGRIYQMLRDPVELQKAAPTFRNLPILITHRGHSARDPQRESVVGTTGSDVQFDEGFLKSSLALWTQDGITAVETGSQRELSCGYRYTPDMTPGTYEGQAYDGVMRNIIGNHVALVKKGRAGSDVVVADNQFEDLSNMRAVNLIEAIRGYLKPDADLAALDAALAPALARDADNDDDEEDDPDNPGAKRKKAKAMDAAAVQRIVAAATSGLVSQQALDAAVAAARTSATADVQALHTAREAVRPLVGVVSDAALNTAEAVYAFALKQAGVVTEGVHASAYPALVQMAVTRTVAPVRIAADSAPRLALVESFPAMSRIARL